MGGRKSPMKGGVRGTSRVGGREGISKQSERDEPTLDGWEDEEWRMSRTLGGTRSFSIANRERLTKAYL